MNTSELEMRRHQAAAARARRAGDESAYRQERTEAKAQQLAARIRELADSDPPLSAAQRNRLAATLLAGGEPR